MKLPHIHGALFDFLTWRRGSVFTCLGIPHKEPSLIANRRILREYAIGYCDAAEVMCRPKEGYMAVMFETKEDTWWTHLTKIEFNGIFR